MDMIKKLSIAVGLVAMLSGTAWASSSITRTSSFAYDAASGLLTQEVVEPDTPALRLQTDYTYDSFGNRLTVTASGSDIATRASASGFDAKGQFNSSNTNALNQSESWQYDARFGSPTSHTGPNGLMTTWSYDSFGRKTQEVLPDGTQTRWAYQFCSGVNGGTGGTGQAILPPVCPAGGVYVIMTTQLAADSVTANGPVKIVYFDSLDREIASQTQGFDGSAIRMSTAYDALGRVSQASRPYFLNGGTPQYTTYTYDALGRVLTRTEPDNSVSQVAYHGLSVTETNALNQTRSTVKNSQGNVVSVTDALGHTMTYAYDAFGNLTTATDASGNVTTAIYDVRGAKVVDTDPDMGSWTYAYNTLGLPVSQTDAKGQTVSQTYDKLDRIVQRVEPDKTSTWTYDTAAHGVGKLASTGVTAGSGAGYSRSVTFDALGRPNQVTTTIDGSTYVMGAIYDANSRLSKVSYPSGFTARYAYTGLGDVSQLLDDATSQVHWTANAKDAELRLTQQTAGNGLVTTSGYDALTGRLTSIATGSSSAVQNLSLSYDLHGNPLSRSDANTNLSEVFSYDTLNRLTASTVNLTPTPLSKTFSYDPVGNLLSKSDVGTYTYPAAGQPRPNAVTGISAGSINATFTYDLNGNQTSGLGRTISWTSYNKPASITQGTRTISFVDDTEYQRFKQVTPEETKLYLSAFGVSAEVTNPGTSSQVWTDYLSVGGPIVGMRTIQTASETVTTRYFHSDHLGSISVITNEAGAVVERLSYDSWGKRRNPNGTDDAAGSITSQSIRGFTGEEQLSVAGLVHLDGRVYDPILAQMTSADPFVSRPTSTQGWNRYAYAGNSPARNVDPTGYDFTEPGNIFIAPYQTAGSFTNGEGPDIGGCNCFNTGGVVYPTPLPTPTIFPNFTPTMPSLNYPAPAPPVVDLFPALTQDAYFLITPAQAQTPVQPPSAAPMTIPYSSGVGVPVQLASDTKPRSMEIGSRVCNDCSAASSAGSPPGGSVRHGILQFPGALLGGYRGFRATGASRGVDSLPAGKGPSKYSVGAYDQVRGTVKGLDAHHVGQKALMQRLIPDYNAVTAPSILLDKVGHTIRGPNGIVSRNFDGLTSPRDVLARDIRELRRVYPDVPNSALQDLIRMNKEAYPDAFER